MSESHAGIFLPKSIEDIDAAFMTKVLRQSGVISATNEVVSQSEQGVGMTAGYFSAIKKVKCTYKEATDAPNSFVVKTLPSFELLPRENIRAMFLKDMKGYQFAQFYPHPKAYLAACDTLNDRFVLVMEDADTFAEHKVHERELNMDEVMQMLPGLVEAAVAWEGCHEGERAKQLAESGVDFWTSDANIAIYKSVMPGGARIADKITTIEGSSVIGPTWDRYPDGIGIFEMFTKKIDAFFRQARPEHGATCTLCHGDLRGDNIFFCDRNATYPHGWLCIDFQLMFRGPVPSDLAYLMSTGSVLPEVYTGDNTKIVLRSFYDQFMARTQRYKDYTYEKCELEYATMSAVRVVYSVGMGAALWQASAFRNEQAVRVELGGKGATEADLSPEELRQRMWWRKVFVNLRENFKTFDQYRYLQSLPENLEGLGAWVDLPDHLK